MTECQNNEFINEYSPSISRNVLWVAFANIFGRGLNFISGIIVARILLPEDFGIISMAATFSGLIDVFSRLGIEVFVVSKQNISKEEINSVYWLNIIIGLAFALIMVIAGPAVATIYKTPEVKNILIFSAYSFFICSLAGVPQALLLKRMRQDINARVELLQSFLNTILIVIFALLGFKYLSFVIPLAIVTSITTAIYLYTAKCKFPFSLDKEMIKQVLNYGKSFMPKTFLDYLIYNSDYIFVGYLLGAKLLGYYFFGFEKAMITVLIFVNITCRIYLPIFSQIQSNKAELKEKFFSLVKKQSFIMYPVFFLQLILASQVINFVWGNRWNDSIFVFICISGYVFGRIMATIIHVLFDAIGHPEYNLKHFLIAAPICVTGLFIGTKLGGLKGVSVAALIVHSLSFFLLLIRTKYMMKWPLKELLKSFALCFIPIIAQIPIIIPLKFIMAHFHIPDPFIIIGISFVSTVLYLYFAKLFVYDIYVSVFVHYKQKIFEKLKLVRA
jgi:lipopolysaccharide exporter